MHDARAVANFFIDRARDQGIPITVMTLLKVLYFAHAWHLVKYDSPLVAQPFEAWRYGPVSRVVYDQLKVFGSKPISQKLVSFNIERGGFLETPYEFENADRQEFLEQLFDAYSQFHAYDLSSLTHQKGSPWDVIWSAAEKRAVPGMEIPNDLIKNWFREAKAQSGTTLRKGYDS